MGGRYVSFVRRGLQASLSVLTCYTIFNMFSMPCNHLFRLFDVEQTNTMSTLKCCDFTNLSTLNFGSPKIT